MPSGESVGWTESGHSVVEISLGEIQRIVDPETRLKVAIELMNELPNVISDAQDEIAQVDTYRQES